MVKSAPLAARKQAMDAALFFSAPWVPKPMINCRKPDRHTKTEKNQRHIRRLTFDTKDCFQVESSGNAVLSPPYTLALKPLTYRVKSKKSKES